MSRASRMSALTVSHGWVMTFISVSFKVSEQIGISRAVRRMTTPTMHSLISTAS